MSGFFQRYGTVVRNFGYLSVLNALNIALPLIFTPYITRVVGATNFGYYMYVLVLVQNINVLTAYGFQFTATKFISQHRDDHSLVERTTSTVLACRLLLAAVCVTVVFALSHWLLDGPERFWLFVTALGMILGDVLVPVWLFQGMERMKYVTVVNASSKLLFTVLIFALILRPEDYRYLLLLNSCGFMLAGILSMVLVRRQFGIHLQRPHLSEIKKAYRESGTLFLSTVGIDLYRNVNVLILNFLVSPAAVGVYALAEKFVKATQSLITPISQALFPHISLKIKNDGIGASVSVIRKTSLVLIVLTLLGAVGLYFGSDILVWITGKDFTDVKPLMLAMTPVLVFGCLNYLLGFVGLVNMGQQRYFFRFVMGSGTMAIVVLLCVARYIGVYAAALSMSLSEILLTVSCVIRMWQLTRQHS